MRIPILPVSALLLFIVPLFFIDLHRWVGDVPPELHAFAHVGFFALFALLAMDIPWLRKRKFLIRSILVLVFILVGSIVIELIQGYFGRSASLRDVRQNMIGAFLGISFYTPMAVVRTMVVIIAAVIAFMELRGPGAGLIDRAVAYAQFPVLGDFETPFERHRWSIGEVDGTVSRSGKRSLRVTLDPRGYSRTTQRRSFGDWSEYGYLEMSIYHSGQNGLPIRVSIRDREYLKRGVGSGDRYDMDVVLDHGWNDLRMPLSEIIDAPVSRQLDVSDIAEIAIFASNWDRARTIHIDRVRLTHD